MIDNPLYRITERMANERAQWIDNKMREIVPKWQQKLLLKFPFLKNWFGYELSIQYINRLTNSGYKTIYTISKNGKVLAMKAFQM